MATIIEAERAESARARSCLWMRRQPAALWRSSQACGQGANASKIERGAPTAGRRQGMAVYRGRKPLFRPGLRHTAGSR